MVSESRRRKLQDPNYGKVPKDNFTLELTEDVEYFPDDIEEEYNFVIQGIFKEKLHDTLSVFGMKLSRGNEEYFGLIRFGLLREDFDSDEARLGYHFSDETPLKLTPYFKQCLEKKIVAEMKKDEHLSSALRKGLDLFH